MARLPLLLAHVMRLLCAVAVLWGGFAKSLPAVQSQNSAADLILYALPDGSLPPLCLPGTTDDGQTGKKMAAHLCDLCLLGASAFLSGPVQGALLVVPPVRTNTTVQKQRPEAFYRQFFPPQAPPIGPPAFAIA
ncbi:MAG: hypothetical protein ACOVQ8_01835 [Elstera sp.]